MAHRIADTQARFVKTQVIYPLKRRYGIPATIYRLDSTTNNVQTGVQQKFYTRVQINRVVPLPQDVVRKFIYDLSFIAANKNFTYGGFFDWKQRIVLIDGKDLPTGFEPDSNDHLEIDGIRHSIKKLQVFEHTNKAWIIALSRIEGEPSVHVFRESVEHTLKFTGVVTNA